MPELIQTVNFLFHFMKHITMFSRYVTRKTSEKDIIKKDQKKLQTNYMEKNQKTYLNLIKKALYIHLTLHKFPKKQVR